MLWLVLLSPCVLVRADAADFDTLPLADALDFEPADSTRISGVRPGSVLDTLGLRAGDVLTAINHQAVQDSTAVRVALSNLDELHLETIDFQRDGRRGVIVNRGSLRSRTFDPIFVQREREPSEGEVQGGALLGDHLEQPAPAGPGGQDDRSIAGDIAERRYTKRDIAALLNGSQAHEKDAEPLGPEAIGDFRWVDVDGSGRRALLVPISHSRAFFNSLEIYEQTSSGVHLVQKIEVWMLASLRDRVKDLDHDGRPELILPVLLDLEEYRGAWPVAMWPAVYRWSGGRFIEASRSFANYYGHAVFPELEAQRQRTEGLLAEGHGRFEPRDEEVLQAVIAATWMAQDKILRVIAEERDAGPDRLRLIEGDPTAGADRAREWMKSPFPQLRQDAALVFADIGARFEGELRSLAHDPDGDVATAARRGLDRLSRPLREGG